MSISKTKKLKKRRKKLARNEHIVDINLDNLKAAAKDSYCIDDASENTFELRSYSYSTFRR